MTKDLIRQNYRKLRRSISSAEKTISSYAITKIIINNNNNLNFYQKKIAVYLASDGELDLRLLIEALWKNQGNVFLPVINATTQALEFSPYFPETLIKINQYGIHEPESDFFVSPEGLDVVFMPLVAFDKTGARLGMGKGYYDKSFAFCAESQIKPILIGVAYSCQCCDKLPIDHWDIPLDGILTEKEFVMFNRKS